MKSLSLLLVLLFCFPVLAKKQAQEKWVQVGDMYVPESMLMAEEDEEFGARGFKESKVRLWKNGIIRYQFGNLTKQEQSQFLLACREMGEFANVQCLPKRAQDRDYIYVQRVKMRSCGSSFLGRWGGKQSLKVRCWRKRTVQHELMHAFGVSHEHNRMDRDDHIEILWDNIKSRSKKSFRKIATGKTSHITNYDFKSIMHYDSRAGAKEGQIAFYRKDKGPKNGAVTQTNVMSYRDHLILWMLYGGEKP